MTAHRPFYVDETNITGSFTVTKESGQATVRGGGACLVADLNDNFACDTRDDCLQAQEDGLVKATPPGGYIYCDTLDGGPKRCWTRPGPNGCTRGPRTPNTYVIATPVPALVDGEEVVWTTLACIAIAGNPTGCGSEDPTQHAYSSSPALEPGLYCDRDSDECSGICGDGLIRGEETCDDANLVGDDGCSADCETEAGYSCDGEPSQCLAVEPTPIPPVDTPDPDDDGEDSGVGGDPAGAGGLGGGGCSLNVRR